jgi:hypothetical protein
MADPSLHLIALDMPWPADYGGAIDMYARLRALKEVGVAVTLHCFLYRKRPAPELEPLCRAVHYYPRPLYRDLLSLSMPYIVASRQHPALLHRLLEDEAPILFEGLHTTALLGHPALAGRRKVVRMHNVEHDYYRHLALRERNVFRRAFFRVEAARLARWESVLDRADGIAAISGPDLEDLTSRYGEKAFLLPLFPLQQEVRSLPGEGGYALYHGNLSVPENEHAALFLLREVFRHLPLPFTLAGKDPSKALREAAAELPHVRLVADPDQPTMDRLVAKAQVLVLPTFQNTGQKAKLLHSLFHGRHVLVNPLMAPSPELDDLLHRVSSPEAFRERLTALWRTPFTEEDILRRREHLFPHYDNRANARALMERLEQGAPPALGS